MEEKQPPQDNKSAGLIEINSTTLQPMIYTIRNQQVMLDFDLAGIYGYEVRTLNQQVKRNISRFPDDFMFQLTPQEVELVKSQIVIILFRTIRRTP